MKFEVIVQYEGNVTLDKHIKDTFDVTIIVDKDADNIYREHPLYVPNGKAYFVFRVSTKDDNKENATKVLSYLKDYIINEMINNTMKTTTEMLIKEMSNRLFKRIKPQL